MEFGYDGFERLLLHALDAGYEVRRLDRARPEGEGPPQLFLRHDVDISPRAARRLGEIEARRGVTATFLFQLDAETYSIFAADVRDTIRALRELGHAVGLHVNHRLIAPDEAAVARTLEWFSSTVQPIDRVASFHWPDPSVLGRRFTSFLSAYDPDFFSQEKYLSDSNRNLRFWPKLEAWLGERRPRIQLLLHPEWWHPHESAVAFWDDLAARRRAELETYVVTNFPPVFADVVAPSPPGTPDRFGV